MRPIFRNRLEGQVDRILSSLGITVVELNTLYDCGFMLSEFPPEDLLSMHDEPWGVIDRWYGPYSPGGTWTWSVFRRWMKEGCTEIAPKPIPEATVDSIEELNSFVESLTNRFGAETLWFRGQTRPYFAKRDVANPLYLNAGLGEELIIPSWYRPIHETIDDPDIAVYHHGVGNWTFVTSVLVEKAFAPRTSAEHGAYFLLDHGDDLFGLGRHLPDISEGGELAKRFEAHNTVRESLKSGLWLKQLITVLQHYGVPTPAVDVTSDPRVAAFFATHQFAQLPGERASFTFDPTAGTGVIYILRVPGFNRTEDVIADLPLGGYSLDSGSHNL